ncbi:hypothetical protein BJF85_24885 [Saccharomonospora sp. CUA-673]|uniref:TetR/AcrR family transcriptional regulator n=1 Tax=Saccharomonospora sp. CUA-673 TaxID=1904969 RepID=UPI00096104CC|nr:TetR/AcrR family transcriptional regulator [Saccharomonospora sp. CUA-673]OLT40528.1 hypothetical protein BJF85_24885 [Saccharomonospora sp. CUA-673]
MNDDIRRRLLDAAVDLLDRDGPSAIQARKVAAEIGASSMAVYTHFGGMPQLAEAIVREGFRRLERRSAAVAHTDDPLADLFALGLAYRAHAVDCPQLYRLMFGITTLAGRRGPRTDMLAGQGSPADLPEGAAAFAHLQAAVDRVLATGDPTGDVRAAAAQAWSVVHGYVLLELAGFFGSPEEGIDQVLMPLFVNLTVGVGADRPTAEAAAKTARSR